LIGSMSVPMVSAASINGITIACTSISASNPTSIGFGGSFPATAALVATSGQSIRGTINASGCDVGIYVGSSTTGVTITATVNNSKLAGIDVDGGSANVKGSTVSNTGDKPFTGDQYGIGIFYVNGATGEVVNTDVNTYQKAGIEVIGADGSYAGSVSDVIVSNDTVNGLGRTPIIAQNGVEFDLGALGSVKNSVIENNSYTATNVSNPGDPACPNENYFFPGTCAQSGGLLLYDGSPSVVVSNDIVSLNDVGIWAYSDGSVPASGSASYVVNNNTVQGNYGYGIVFDSFNGTATNDTISDSPVGILTTTSSASATVAVNNNTFSSVTTNYQSVPESTYAAAINFNPKVLVLKVNADITNDEDSGNSGFYWAMDNFNRVMEVWQTGPQNYTINFTDTGTSFIPAGGKSPQNGATELGNGTASMKGEQSWIVNGVFSSTVPSSPGNGFVPVLSTSNASAGTYNAQGTISDLLSASQTGGLGSTTQSLDFVNSYFTSINSEVQPGYTYSYTYNSPFGNQTWIDTSNSSIAPGEIITNNLVLFATAKVVNDQDSGYYGNWALDNYTRTIRVWQTGLHSFAAIVSDSGNSYITAGSPSPGNGVTQPFGGVTTMNGNQTVTFNATSVSASAPTNNALIGTYNMAGNGGIQYYLTNGLPYFTGIDNSTLNWPSGYSYAYTYTPVGGATQTWIDSSSVLQPQSGDIVVAPIVITSPTATSAVDVGQQISLNATESGGSEPFTVGQWYESATDINASGAPVGTSGSLNTTNTQSTSGTIYYYLVVSDGSQTAVSSAIPVTVNPTPEVTSISPLVSSLDIGQYTILTASATGGTGTLNYQWMVNGVPVGDNSKFYDFYANSSTEVNNTALVIVTDSAPTPVSARGTISMTVSPLPIVSVSGTRVADVGQNITLTAALSSGAQIAWYNDTTGTSVLTSQGPGTSFLTVQSTPGTYAYYAVATDSNGGTGTSGIASVTVNSDPSITSLTSNAAVDVGQSTTLTAVATGGTGATTSWTVPAGLTIGSGCTSGAANCTITGANYSSTPYVVSLVYGDSYISASNTSLVTVNSASVSGTNVTATSGGVILGRSATGQASLPSGASNIILNGSDSTLNLSASLQNSSGGNVMIDGSSVSLSNIVTTSGTVNLTAPQDIGGQSVQVSQAVQLTSGVANTPIVITNSGLPGISVSIPDNTVILASSNWTGTITPPSTGFSLGTPPSGFSIGNTVIEVGSPGSVLLLSQPATLLLSGVTGNVAYEPSGSSTWTQITDVCGGTYASPAAPVFPGECYISNGTSTEIVTYHFTKFGSLDTFAPPSSSGSSSASGSSGGGAGGSSAPTVTQSGNGYDVSNIAQSNTFDITMGTNINGVENYITPSSAGVSLNGVSYVLSPGSPVQIGSNSSANRFVELTDISYTPSQQTISLSFYSVSVAPPQTPAANPPQSNGPSNSTVATTTIAPTPTVPTANSTAAAISPTVSVVPPSSSSNYLIVAIVGVIAVVAVLAYYSARQSKRIRKR
jgi:hypothetical protein